MTLVRWNPVRSLSFEKEMNHLFHDILNESQSSDRVWQPVADLAETDKNYEVRLEIPGIKKEEIKISFQDGVLSIQGERRSEEKKEDKNYHRVERLYGKFERFFSLPNEVKGDEIKAGYNDGILTVEIPKTEKVLPRQIEIK